MTAVLAALFIICLGISAVLGILLFRQKRTLRGLSEQITYILDGNDYDHIGSLQKYTEGELAVLESQVGKLVNLLREQAQGLKEDKAILQNAMADLSHQLKTPMTSMHLVVAMLAEEELSQEQRLGYVEHGTQLLNRIDWLVSTLLKLSRLDAGPCSLPESGLIFKSWGKQPYGR